jgi:serine protease inhibitor
MGTICSLPQIGCRADILTRKIMAQKNDHIISPYFIFTSLMTLYYGAEYSTKDKLCRLLEINPYIYEWNEFRKQLIRSKELIMIIHMSISRSMRVNSDFMEMTENIFNDVSIEKTCPTPFCEFMELISPPYRKMMARKTTGNKITIAGTIGFKSLWKYPFEESETFLCPVIMNGKTIDLPMMHQILTTKHYETEEYQYLELELKNSEFVFCIILPRNDEYICHNKYDTLITGMNNAKLTSIELYIPKFAHHYHIYTKSLINAIEPNAHIFENMNLDEMINCPFKINSIDIIYNISVVINESGIDCYKISEPDFGLKPDDRDIKETHNILFCCNKKFSGSIIHKPTMTIIANN